MGIARNTSAISAGILAIALGGAIPLAAPAPANARDCAGGGGLLSGVTNTLCSVTDGVAQTVNQVTDVADKVTGGATKPVTKAVDDVVGTTTSTVGTAVNDVGKTVDDTLSAATGSGGQTPAPSSGSGGAAGAVGSAVGSAVGGAVDTVRDVTGAGGAAGPAASPAQALTDGLSKAVRDTCLPLVGGGCVPDADEGRAKRPKEAGAPVPSARPGTLPTEPARPSLSGYAPAADETGSPVRVHPDEDGMIPLLWPGLRLPQMSPATRGAVIRPHRPHDGTGTALTALLLLSAVLATRVVSARRARAEQQESIPFEGGLRVPGRSGRHRLA
ncbi:hypothetical protein JOL79_07455 [Microbispora sp. RL4-1S]|uniref:Uncharacterized protein n=1 Tax=Microbispora oryzae TaxID=2806554 RepID=A0A940WLF4_9ACTN|nr:hypothetical protein [Microbispora oryzae]MBP2703635.1 hypothetical protein [Microbispora oryzae]